MSSFYSLVSVERRDFRMSSHAPLNNHDANKQADTNTDVGSSTDNTLPASRQYPDMLSATDTTTLSTRPIQQSLTPKEIEQICRAFIRLIRGSKTCQDFNRVS